MPRRNTSRRLLIILSQHGRIRSPVDKRFLGVLAAIVVFAVIYPFVLGYPHNSRGRLRLQRARMAMFCYIVAGIWFDMYLFWVGLSGQRTHFLSVCFSSQPFFGGGLQYSVAGR